MSRSYQKNPWVNDRNPFMKNYANRRVRRISPYANIHADGNWYRRYTCPYDICDWKWKVGTFEQYHSHPYTWKKATTRGEDWAEYRKLITK